MKKWTKVLEIRSSPHIASGHSVDTIMFNVVMALLPAAAFAVFQFGLAALLTIGTAVTACVAFEHLFCRLSRQETSVGDWSAVITGLLYGLTLPPGLALWMVVVGAFAAIGLGKFLFGGLGYNPFNPALVGRAMLQAAFPVAMTTWPDMPVNRFSSLPSSTFTMPFTQPSFDAVSSATPLSAWKFEQVMTSSRDLFFGTVGGSAGETCAVLILVGGIYLALRGMMNWRIPLAVLFTVAVISGMLHLADPSRYAGPVFMMMSGGLMLGAVFMATDMVASPMTHLGSVVYGVFIGLLVVVIRVWGGMPEGVMYAILLGNAISPHIDNWIQPKVYGTQKGGRKDE